MTRIVVRGIPVAQGSVRAFVAGGRAIVATDAKRGNLGAWRGAIATEARAVYGRAVAATRSPVSVTIALTWPRPRAHYRLGKHSAELRADAPTWKSTAPDVDKAARACLDALAGIAFGNDAQVAELRISKQWGDVPGAVIDIDDLHGPTGGAE